MYSLPEVGDKIKPVKVETLTELRLILIYH